MQQEFPGSAPGPSSASGQSDSKSSTSSKPVKKPRVSTACYACRRKRAKCDGGKPSCIACRTSGSTCEYDLAGDRRKPYGKDVVAAMELQIQALQAQLASATLSNGGGGTSSESEALPPGVKLYGAHKNVPLDAFQGGLAINAHNELRFYGPTSAYRAVLADCVKGQALLDFEALPDPNEEAARKWSLTRAPIPGAMPADPTVPTRPPVLAPEFTVRIVQSAFQYCFSHFNVLDERAFYHDMDRYPHQRTAHYSPFLLNVVLGIGCRYLDPNEDFPLSICADQGDRSTRGDVFINWARYLVDQEWYNPKISTVKALVLLGVYLAGRGLDGPAMMLHSSGMRLVEDFGLHLGIHRLAIGVGGISDDLIVNRRNTFWSAFSGDVLLSLYVGRAASFTVDGIDQVPPPVDNELEYSGPFMHQSSALHWGAKLMLIASRITNTVYALKPGISVTKRASSVPDLHLALEQWNHALPSHLRATRRDAKTAPPPPHVIGLNMLYYMFHIQLHRPFIRRLSNDPTENISTEKCLNSANQIVKLVRLQKSSHGLRMVHPSFQHAAFMCGTILALSATEDGLSGTPSQDSERRQAALESLTFVIEALRDIGGATWTTACTSADILDSLIKRAKQPTPGNNTSEDATNGIEPWNTVMTGTENAAAAWPFVFASFGTFDEPDAADFMRSILSGPADGGTGGHGGEAAAASLPALGEDHEAIAHHTFHS